MTRRNVKSIFVINSKTLIYNAKFQIRNVKCKSLAFTLISVFRISVFTLSVVTFRMVSVSLTPSIFVLHDKCIGGIGSIPYLHHSRQYPNRCTHNPMEIRFDCDCVRMIAMHEQ